MNFSIDDITRSPCGRLNKHLHQDRPKQNKFHNKKVEIDGFTFDSLKESRRYISLKTLQTIGTIKNLHVHIPFRLSVATYICDFVYENSDGDIIVEDVKSKATRTAAYRLKKKMLLQELNIEIEEV